MEPTLFFSVVVLLFSFSTFTSCYSSQYQTLVLDPLLSSSQTLSWPEPESLASESESTTSLSLPLSHINDLYPSDASPSDHFKLRHQQDSLRVKSIINLVASKSRGFSGPITSGLPQFAEYFMRLGVGTPPKDVYMVLDTGSDIIWQQCLPCKSCYNQSDPIFDPTKSKSYATIPCGSSVCQKLDPRGPKCVKENNNTCFLSLKYGDGSVTNGDYATETLTFPGSSVHHIVLGCAHFSQGLFGGAGGLIGLARSEFAFPSQTKNRYNGKFSYCFTERKHGVSSKPPPTIVFGDNAIPKNAVFTPMLTNPKLDLFYYLPLLGISIGGSPVRGIKKSQFKIDPNTGHGGVIIDSGTTLTILQHPVYVAFRDAFRLGTSHLKRGHSVGPYDTCYDLSGMTKASIPTMVFHFIGVDVSIPASNILVELEDDGLFCFAFSSTRGNLSIIGNVLQRGFRVSYDLVGSHVGFLPNAC